MQKLSGFGIIKTEVQSSLLLLTSSDLRPDNSLVLIFSFLIKMKTKHNKNIWVWWHITRELEAGGIKSYRSSWAA